MMTMGTRYVIVPLTPGGLRDTDEDGVVDCLDSDDDNDFLTDEWEELHMGTNRLLEDSDNDGTEDPWSIHPIDGVPEWTITAWDYDSTKACDEGPISSSMPDPWISKLSLTLLDTWDQSLPAPPGWQEADHVDDRGAGVVSDLVLNDPTNGRIVSDVMPLDTDIRAYGTSDKNREGGLIGPRVHLEIQLEDHDDHLGGDDETIDLNSDAEKEDAKFEALLTGGTQRPSSTGSDECWGMLQFSFSDNVLSVWICTALEHVENPNQLIGTDTDTSCS